MTTTNVGNVNLACSGNNTVSDMSCMFVVGINGGKNIYVNNVWLEGRTNIDCFLASGAFSNVVFNSCIMRSTYDVGVVAGQSTNNTLTLLNCDAQTLVPPGTTNAARAFPVGGGLFRVYGGSIRTLQGHETGGFHAFCVGTESGVTAGTAAIELSGVTLIAQSTNATAYTIYNASSVPISARGMLLKRSTTSGPFSAEGDFVDGLQSTNLVLFASTNMIKFAGTNTAPATPGTINKWISVQVEGESAAYRIPLYQ
jgi:hypothetical protein